MPPANATPEELLEWCREKAMRQVIQKDRHKIRLAETGAQLALTRKVCSLKSSYKREELEKPFVIYRVTVDFRKALAMGGQVGQKVLDVLSSALSTQLGVQPIEAKASLPSPEELKLMSSEDFETLTDDEADSLVEDMLAAGFRSRAVADRKTQELFGSTVSNLTKRHATLIRELIELSGKANEVLDGQEARLCVAHLSEMANLAYLDGISIADAMEQGWYDKMFPKEEEEGEAEEDFVPISTAIEPL